MDYKMGSKEREDLLLSGLFPLSVGATKNYTPDLYEDAGVPEDMRPTFRLRGLTASEKDEWRRWQNNSGAKIREKMAGMTPDELDALVPGMTRGRNESQEDFVQRKNQAITMSLAIRYFEQMPADFIRRVACSCIMGWSNFLDVNGQAIEYQGGDQGLDTKLWGLIPEEVADALAGYVNQISGLTPIEKAGLRS